jgi:pSer/pThr/pTyr-binding forkhead associated (FHA) protein
MQIDIELVGKTNRWSYQHQRVRIGRDPSCDVSLPGDQYPMVSREHVVLETSGAGLKLTDAHSSNGTYLNGSRVTAATLTSGDTLRLGVDGPELRIYLKEAQAVAGSPQANGTRLSPLEQNAPGLPATSIYGGAPQDSGATMLERGPGAVSAEQQQASERAVRVSFGSPSQAEAKAAEPSAIPNHAAAEAAPGEEIVIERKLNQMRNLLAANLVVVLLLLIALFYQGQQITKTKDAVIDLRKGAESAVQQFTPALDARLSAFDKRVDGMDARLDAKMKTAEDRFAERMKQQMPQVLDAYVARAMDKVKRQAEGMRP